MKRMGRAFTSRLTLLVCLVMLIPAVLGCQSEASTTPQTNTTANAAISNMTTEQTNTASLAEQNDVESIEPLAPEQAAAPARLQIETAGIDAPVTPMGWRIATVDGERTTVWDVPEESIGWHVNSVGAGAAGNVILSGRQIGGAAVFAPLALNAVSIGAKVLLTDADGITFVYQIFEITEPIPIAGASPEEESAAGRHFAQTDQALLTLASGWPEFTTTHRIFAIAEFKGIRQ